MRKTQHNKASTLIKQNKKRIIGSEKHLISPWVLGTLRLCSIRQGSVGFAMARADPVHGEKLSFSVIHRPV